MSQVFVGLIDSSDAYNFVAGNVKAFYDITKKVTDKAAIRRMGKQVGVDFTQTQVDEIYSTQTDKY